MSFIYELHYEKEDGGQVFCNDFYCELEVMEEMRKLQIEFPENQYWYDIVEGGSE